jgi:hypothetical protein
MPTPVRTRIVEAIKARMQTILVANGYETNLGQKVFVWRATDFEPAELSAGGALNIKDMACEVKEQTARIWHNILNVELVALGASADLTDELVGKFSGDLIKACGVDRHWTEAATSAKLAYNSGVSGYQFSIVHETKRIGGVKVNLAVHFRTPAFDPFTLAHA